MLPPMGRITQLVVVPVIQVAFDVVHEFPISDPGADRFDSTGHR